jgi:hypothetical protein
MLARFTRIIPRRGGMTETITIVRTCDGKRLAKLIRAGGAIADYDHSFLFDLVVHPVANLDQICRLLCKLLQRPDCAVVRGTVADPARVTAVRRLVNRDDKTGDEPTLREVPRQWLALDIEGVDRPAAIPAGDLVACAKVATQRLPTSFHGAACMVQATAGHGIKPGCRLRLWYWLTRPTTGTELTLWLRGSPADPAVFRPAQVIYTSAPVFERGAVDHLPERIASLPGQEAVPVPPPEALLPPQRKRDWAPLRAGETRAARYAFAALTRAACRIQQAPDGQRHTTIMHEALDLARLVAARVLSEPDFSTVLHEAGARVGLGDREIGSIVAWALAHPGAATLPDGVVS